MRNENRNYNPHISVDCVLLGYKEGQLSILMVERIVDRAGINTQHNKKLPGGLIMNDEDLDQAPGRVMNELTGLPDLSLMQFKTFGNLSRTEDPNDKFWIENLNRVAVGRLITVAYVSLIKLVDRVHTASQSYQAKWYPLSEVLSMKLAFDHNEIVTEALEYIRKICQYRPIIIFNLLPKKFTAFELRRLCEVLHNTVLDIRNFHKKIVSTPFIVPLDEKQKGVSHRAARLYKFDRKMYNKLFSQKKDHSKEFRL